MASSDTDQTPDESGGQKRRPGRPPGQTGAARNINRVEVNDEGVRVLVEIQGVSAVRAASIMQAVLSLVFDRVPDAPVEHGGVLSRISRGGAADDS